MSLALHAGFPLLRMAGLGRGGDPADPLAPWQRGLLCPGGPGFGRRCGLRHLSGDRHAAADLVASHRPSRPRHPAQARRAVRRVRRDRQRCCVHHEPLCDRLRPRGARAAPGVAGLRTVSARHESGAHCRRRVLFPDRVGIHVALFLGAGGGAPPRRGEQAGRPALSDDGGAGHARALVRVRRARRRRGRLYVRCGARPRP